MKKLIIVQFLFAMSVSLIAQEKFTVPELSEEQKYKRMVSQANFALINSISYAKYLGQSVEDVARFTGNQAKISWNRESGFDGFVQGTLTNWKTFIPHRGPEIIEQREGMIKFRTGHNIPNFKNQGERNNVTYDEFLKFLRIVHEIIGEHLGATYSQNMDEDGMIITITNK